MKKNFLFILAFLGALSAAQTQTTLPPGFAEATVAEGLNPTSMALAPDGRIFLAQKDGRVLIFHSADGELHGAPFITLNTDAFNERGLNGIALDPNFEQQPWVYLYYTPADRQHNRVSRVLANGDFAVPGSEQVLLDLDLLSGSVHNAGALTFGPDGKLYVGTGDGAMSNNSQDLNTTLGKILRINPNGSIPADNPFYNQLTSNNRAIYAYGTRNPFSMSADPVSGKIFFCDVGAEAWEELNELKPSANYGWKLFQGASGNPAFQDPLFAYNHNDGCAIVGAAFAFQGHSLIPSQFQGKFFFADYCSGWIKMLDPASGALLDTFATGLDRPVSLLALPNGELYYLARAGLGGGSQQDNTASNNGTLQRVFWVGEGEPLVTGHPQPALVAEGESVEFRGKAFGGQPIQYQWFLNGAAMPGEDSTVLLLENLSLADDGSAVFFTASNSFGTDTSQTALVGVSSNKRPLPEILLPLANTLYRGGGTLYFSGQANDPEEGILLPEQLTWRIDLHHADHVHPAMPPVSGIASGQFVVPSFGETSTDVFFRVYLTARDEQGFEKTTWRDVFPQKTQIEVAGPPGIKMNVDGQIRLLPAVFESVVGIERAIQAPEAQRIGDVVYNFEHWADGSTDPLVSFVTPDSAVSLEAFFSTYNLGNGTGLLGQYFFDPQGDLDESPTLTRTDTVVNFNWGDGSPDPLLLPDYFTVRWLGFVEPLFSENYSFSVSSDDGCRLWVGDSLLIDRWEPQATTEHNGSITLKAGKKYRLRLEYLEIGGGANVQLFWGSPHQNREIVPKRQFYPQLNNPPATLRGHLGLDVDNDGAWESGEPTFEGTRIQLFDAMTDSLLAVAWSLSDGGYAFTDLPTGSFYLKITLPTDADAFLPVQNVDAEGRTPVCFLTTGETKTLDAAWAVTQIALGGDVWLDKNRDNVKDPTEPLLPDITVLVYRADSVLVAAGMTSPQGQYGFPLLAPGAYFMLFLDQLHPVPLSPGFGLNAQGQTETFDIAQGQYRVQDVAFLLDTSTSGVGEKIDNQPFQIKIWPNPAGETLWLEMTGAGDLETHLRVFDAAGREVATGFPLKIAPAGAVNVASLPPGVYLLLLENEKGRAGRKFVKQ